MAIADNILHMERSRTATIVNGTERTLAPSAMGNGNLSGGHAAVPKFKKRKVSAVRDFPPGCGRFATKIVENSSDQCNDGCQSVDVNGSSEPILALADTDGMENKEIKAEEAVWDFPLGCGFNESDQGVDSKKTEEAVRDFPLGCGFSESGQGVDSKKAEEAVRDFPLGCGFNGSGQGVDSKCASACQSVEVPRNFDSTLAPLPSNGLELEEEKAVVASPEAMHVNDSDISMEIHEHGSAKTVKYPPRRRVSAVRDFPPFCGRNAPPLMKECLNEVSSLKNKNLGDDNQVEDGKALKGKDGLDEKQTEGSLNRDSENSEGDGNMFESQSEEVEMADGRANKVESKLDDVMATHVVRGNQVASPSEETSEGNSRCNVDLEEPSGDEIMRNKGEKGNKMKHSDGSRHEKRLQKECNEINCFPNRIIVQGVMASPNCPWQMQGQALRSPPPSDGLAENRTVKHRNLYTDKSKSSSKKSMKKEQESWSKTSKESPSVSGKGNLDDTSNLIVRETEDSLRLDEQSEKSKSAPSNMKKEARLSEGSTSKQSLDIPGDATDDGRKQLIVFTEDPVPLKQHSEKPKSGSRKKTKANKSGGKASKKKITGPGEKTDDGARQIVLWEEQEAVEVEEQAKDLKSHKRRTRFSVNLPPFGHGSSGESATATRNKVRETLRLYQAVCRKLLQEEEAKAINESKSKSKSKRVDLQAEAILKDKGRFLNTNKVVGELPGVEVGDEFQYRAEIRIVGLHSPMMGGIDYVKQGGKIIATSIVSSGAYKDDFESSDFLVYTGQGGHVVNKKKEPEDQKLERGNLALCNSVSEQNPVRVIRGLKETRPSSSSNAKPKSSILYTYDGLYVVEKYWQEPGQHGKLVFKFRLKRMPSQPELAWKVVSKSKKHEAREGLCVKDISQGKESMPIPAVNTIDGEKPPPFKYIPRVMYPNWCRPIPPKACECSSGCSDSEKCACAVKNGGEIPYNFNGAIVEAKPLVYECGPLCKCPPSCHNRVSQHGIKFPLEIFKTESRGWGVRSLTSIASGSFICEYIGELLEDKEAEARAGNDEYLFDIGNNYNDTNLWDGLATLIPDSHLSSSDTVDEVGFTIDAAEYGNIGRFVNHSCSPNLYAQNVLHDHVDKRIPHIMLFAAENIPPLQELTYHYNYVIDQVRDSDGNIKQKRCFCGSSECTGRMY